MSTTVLEELVVEFGLDHKKFDQGRREVDESYRKLLQGSEQATKEVAQNTMQLSEVFSIARKGALGLLGAFAGGEAAAFVGHVVAMDAATGRMSKTIGTSVANLSTWQYMVKQVGGEASSATSALSTLQQEIENVRQGGGMFEGGFATLMNRAGVSIRDDADASYRKIQSYIAGQVVSGQMKPPEAATWLRRVPGMNQDMINVMLDDFQKIEAEVKKAGTANAETADAAEKLTAKFNLMTQAMERLGARLIPLIDLMMKPLGEIGIADIKKAFGIATGGGAPTPAEPENAMHRWLSEHLSGFSDQALMGWMFGSSPGSAASAAGSRGNRNNNPGNLEYGPFARSHGATGSDGRFAIFPDAKTGSDAQIALIQSGAYRGLTLDQFGNKYSEGAPAWKQTVGGALGIGPGDIVNNQDPRLIDAIRRAEGTGGGARAAATARSVNNARTSTSTSTSDVSIGQIVLPGVKDADGFAREVGPAMKRSSLVAPANYALT